MTKERFGLVSVSLLLLLLLAGPPARGAGAEEAEPVATSVEAPAGEASGDAAGVEACAAYGDETAPQRIVRRAYEACWERPVHFREIRTTFSRGGSDTVERRIWWLPPEKLRVEEENDRGRLTLLWNEDGRWVYDSRFPYVLHIEGSRPTLPFGAPRRFAASHPSPLGEWFKEDVPGPGGRSLLFIEWRRPGGGSRWWIERDGFFPWKEEHFGPDGHPAAIIFRTDVTFDAEFDDDVFTFEVPEGAEVLTDAQEWRRRVVVDGVLQEAPFRVVVPRRLPDGYTLVGGGVTEVDGKPAVHWRFHDGEKLLSVFQVPEETQGRRREPGLSVLRRNETTVVTAVRGDSRLFVVGDVTEAEAQDIFSSLEEIER